MLASVAHSDQCDSRILSEYQQLGIHSVLVVSLWDSGNNLLVFAETVKQFLYSRWFAHGLAMLHSIVNPVIYFIRNARFREGFCYFSSKLLPCIAFKEFRLLTDNNTSRRSVFPFFFEKTLSFQVDIFPLCFSFSSDIIDQLTQLSNHFYLFSFRNRSRFSGVINPASSDDKSAVRMI